jgi:hypothetical protein
MPLPALAFRADDQVDERRASEQRFSAMEDVVLLEDYDAVVGTVPAGSSGMVHESLPDGSWYLVEFDGPEPYVFSIPGSLLRRE